MSCEFLLLLDISRGYNNRVETINGTETRDAHIRGLVEEASREMNMTPSYHRRR